MLKILRKRGEIAPEEQFLLLLTIFCYLMLDLYVKRGIRFSLRDKRLFEIAEVEITRVDCSSKQLRELEQYRSSVHATSVALDQYCVDVVTALCVHRDSGAK